MKQTTNTAIIALILSLGLLIVDLGGFAAFAQEIAAKVTYRDGTTIVVENPTFLYTWYHRRYSGYLIKKYHHTESEELHFKDVVRNIEFHRVLNLEDLSTIELTWPPKDIFCPEKVIITDNKGNRRQFREYEFDVPSEFLLGKVVDNKDDEAVFFDLKIQGIGILEGQKGKMSARLTCLGGVSLKASETIKKVIFFRRQPHSRLTKRANTVSPQETQPVSNIAGPTKDYLPRKVSLSSHRKQWAVVVGISRFKYSGRGGLKNLIFADDDAKAFTGVLKNLGWSESHIKLLINEEATLRNVMIALESWLTKAGSNDQIVLFWAGHGFPDPEDPEKVYFACYDTDVSIPATGYRMDKVRTALEERKARNVILLADTCHAGKLITRGDRGISIIPELDKMRREKIIPKGWIFMVGADTDRQAIEHTSWTNGAFTYCLVKALSGEADGYESVGPKDGIVTMAELRAYLNSAMPNITQKVLGVAKRPVITTSTGDPDIWNLTLQAK